MPIGLPTLYVLSVGLKRATPWYSVMTFRSEYLKVWVVLTALRKLDSCFRGEQAVNSCIYWFVDVLCFIYKWNAILVIGWFYIMIVIQMLVHYLWVSFPFTLYISPKFTTCICFLLGVHKLAINFLKLIYIYDQFIRSYDPIENSNGKVKIYVCDPSYHLKTR